MSTLGFVFKEVDRGFDNLRKQLEAIKDGDSYVRAGVVGEKAAEDHGGITDGDLAQVHEYGATVQRGGTTIVIPARPFIRTSFDNHRAEYVSLLRDRIGAVYGGEGTIPEALAELGRAMAADQRTTINQGEFAPLKESTVEKKGTSQPLIDTGQLLRALGFDVKLSGKQNR